MKSRLVTFLYPKFSEILFLLIISSWVIVYKCIILSLGLLEIMGAVPPLSFSTLAEPNFNVDRFICLSCMHVVNVIVSVSSYVGNLVVPYSCRHLRVVTNTCKML